MAEKIGAGQVAPVMYDYGQEKFFLQDNDDLVNPLVTATADTETDHVEFGCSGASLVLSTGTTDLSGGTSIRKFIPAPLLQQVATAGAPSLLSTNTNDTYVFYWSMSGVTAGQSVVGITDSFAGGKGIKVSVLLITPTGDPTKNEVWRVRVSPLTPGENIDASNMTSAPVITQCLNGKKPNTRILDTCLPVDPTVPLVIRIYREISDPSDTWETSTGIAGVFVEPVYMNDVVTVQSADKYNAWPFIISSGTSLVCLYSSGATHTMPDTTRSVYRKISLDGGNTWGPSSPVTAHSGLDESVTGKGVMKDVIYSFIRRGGLESTRSFHLYQSKDSGNTWQILSSPTFSTTPLHIGDIFEVPTVGMMAFYHAGTYGGSSNSWGVIKSVDGGATWEQVVVETGLTTAMWPTEASGVYVGGGKILALARIEDVSTSTTARANFQLTSTDYGSTWVKTLTNITDVVQSTPTIIYDSATDRVDVYYYQRSRGVLKHRTAKVADVFSAPLLWVPASAIALGSKDAEHAGNANACSHDGEHKVVYYSGNSTNTEVVVASVT